MPTYISQLILKSGSIYMYHQMEICLSLAYRKENAMKYDFCRDASLATDKEKRLEVWMGRKTEVLCAIQICKE